MSLNVYYFTEMPYHHIDDELAEQWPSLRLTFPNSYFDPNKATDLFKRYLDEFQYAEEAGFQGLMINEHHNTPSCMDVEVNITGGILARMTSKAKILMLGNMLPTSDNPPRLAEEIAMLDVLSGGRIVSGFVRGIGVDSWANNTNPVHNRERFEECHDLIIKTWTTPGPFRWEGKHYQYRVINPWVRPIQQPHPPIWFPGLSSPESVVWAAKHQHPYMNLGSLLEYTEFLKGVYIDTAKETGFQPGPEHFGYLLRVLCADTDEEAQRIGNHFQWTEDHRNKGPVEHNDPPGYQSREAVRLQRQLPGVGRFGKRMSYQELQDADNVIVGSPKTVTEKLSRIIGRLNPGYLHIYGNEGDMPHEASMRSIELLGKEVIPALHDIQLKPYEE